MWFHKYIISFIAGKVIAISVPAMQHELGTTWHLRITICRILHIIHIDHFIVLYLISKYGNVSHIPIHALHQTLILVHKSTHRVPRINGSRQMAEGLLGQITWYGCQHLSTSTSRHFAIWTTGVRRVKAKVGGAIGKVQVGYE